jgi:hypothetical protein
VFSPLQPGETFAILATLLDVATTLYGVLSGRAAEGNFIYGAGRRAALLVVILSVALHLTIRWSMADHDGRGFDPRQGAIWSAIATIRGAVAAWNIGQILKFGRRA